MAETEVETILREIRERVLAQQRSGRDVAVAGALTSNGANGAGEPGSPGQVAQLAQFPQFPQSPSPGQSESLAAGNLSLINSYLTTTARAWDRLPPVVSNRSGFVARVELWLKRRLRTATRWFTWEQVNFNAAVHHALRDMLPVFAAYEAELQKLRAQLADAETRVEAQAEARAEARAKEFGQALAAQASDLQAQIETQSRANERRSEARTNQIASQLVALVNELRERDAHLRDEQRVCYKQLALENTEAAVLEDRARRKTEASLEELTKRVEQLEK